MESAKDDIVEFENLRLNRIEHTIYYGQKEIIMTNREFQVLYFLMLYQGQVFSKSQIYNQVVGQDDKDSLHTVEITISRIRNKLKTYTGKDDLIITVRGCGYKFKKKNYKNNNILENMKIL